MPRSNASKIVERAVGFLGHAMIISAFSFLVYLVSSAIMNSTRAEQFCEERDTIVFKLRGGDPPYCIDPKLLLTAEEYSDDG